MVADTLPLDSAEAAALRDSFFEIQSRLLHYYRRFPTSVDSLIGFPGMGVHSTYSTDASGVSEVLANAPTIVHVPFSLPSILNRALLYGFPISPSFVRRGSMSSDLHFDAIYGTDLLFASQTRYLSTSIGAEPGYRLHPFRLVSPELNVMWENGVFDENILDVRFARPITENTVAAVFSNYRHFDRRSFSHDYNNVYDFYAALVEDTSILSNRGISPLIDEHVSGIRLSWQGQTGTVIDGTYRYVHAENDLVKQNEAQVDSLGQRGGPVWGPLEWERFTKWNNLLQVHAGNLSSGPLFTEMDFSLEHGGHKVAPLPLQRGERTSIEAHARAGIGFQNDTVSVPYRFALTRKSLYVNEQWESQEHLISAKYARRMEVGPLSLRTEFGGGGQFRIADTLNASRGVWSANVGVETGGQKIRAFAETGAIGFEPPYDIDQYRSGHLLDGFDKYGLEMLVHVRKMGLLFSVISLPGIDSTSAKHYWPQGVLPYEMPSTVFSFAPVVGRYKGLSAEGKFMFSDKKPFLKARLMLSYETALVKGNAHPRVDLVLNYWGERGSLVFGNPELWDQWGREIIDVSIRLSMQIHSFRLFHKIDNILNRRIAYVPGYFMPGITFRWGFNWLIPG